MGETKEIQLHRGVKLARIVTAAMAGLFFFIVLAQIVLFPNVQITFNTGADAQQIASISIKKGTEFELPTPLKPGSCFLGWSLTPNGQIIKSSKGFLKNTTLHAVWDGAEKYAVLSVNGIPYKEVNIFDTRIDGLTPAELSENWRILDDYALDNPNRVPFSISGIQSVTVDPNNNFSRFLGWQYLNSYGHYNELRFNADATGMAGDWTLIERDADGNEKYTTITDTNKFYPPNYRTTFTALLEYRNLEIQFYHKGDSTSYKTITVNMGEEVKLPKYENPNDPYLSFSHWELQIGDLNTEYANAEQKPDLVKQLSKIERRYQAGEIITTPNPLWYYFGSELISSDGSARLVTILEMHAVHWNHSSVPQYTIQPFTDLNSGEEYIDAGNVGFNDLSLETPVAFEDECIWFFQDDRILSYSFYDHDGVYHEIKTADLQNSTAGGIHLDRRTTYLGQEVYFNSDWAINIVVNYQSSAENILVKFNYGTDLYLLPNYRFYENPEVTQYIRKIGNTFVLLTGEKYLKTDHIFTGWRLVGDATERLYCAGESFTIPNFNIAEESNVIEFEAVWHLQRLLFSFDFNGGDWENEQGPDFTLMKGAFGDRVQIVKDIPVRFGYDFVGWSLDSKTYTDESELLQPGQVLNVGAKMQTLYAQWQPRRLRVIFYGKEINDTWRLKKRINEDFYTQEQICVGGYIEMPTIKDTNWSTFNGWVVGDELIASYEVLQLTTEVLSQLETRETSDLRGAILEVRIYADETRNTVDLVYDLEFVYSDDEKFAINVDPSKLQTILVQGTRFFDYYPFSLNQKDLDTNGRQFTGWSYSESGSNERIKIDSSTIVPVGVKKITIYVDFSESKSFSFQYHDFNGNYFTESNTATNYGGQISLIYSDELGKLPKVHETWGTFVGWALEQDQIAGNPELIFLADENNKVALKLSNRDDTSNAPYLVNIDRHAKQVGGSTRYVLKLYAVYAIDFTEINYQYLESEAGQYTSLKLPVYANGNYEKTVNGGKTVGVDSADFVSYGNAVLDDSTLVNIHGRNFVGWKATVADGVDSSTKACFENKIWFPGEPLPSIDFNIKFEPIRVKQNSDVQIVTVGEFDYRVLSLADTDAIIINQDVDVVALPRGTYTFKEGAIKINSNREVHVVIPSYTESHITLEPRAIQCDTIKEFYVGDNLIISGSPVVGANFQTYRVSKGYRLMDENGAPTEIQKPSTKYDYESSLYGLLVSKDCKTLYGVPSHVVLTSDELFNYLGLIGIQRINSYALSDLNNLSTINLGFAVGDRQEFYLEANAIYNGNAIHIILPTTQGTTRIIDASVIAGALPKLHTVTFGDTTTVNSSYAFVADGYVYYVDNLNHPTAKTHVMYVLPTAKLESLAFTTRNLRFENTVTKIEPCALMGRDWSQINSIMIENKQIDVRDLVKNIQSNIPVFISVENKFKDSYTDLRIQSYVKTFKFICNNSDTVYKEKTIEYSYGETFNVFNAQKNSYEFEFDRTWCQFIGWKVGTSQLLKVGEVYKVGISDIIKGDQYTVRLDASSADCWVNFPVQFYIFDGKNNIPYIPEAFYDGRNNEYEINELLSFYDYLGEIYLPGVDGSFTASDGSHYQFVGWGTSQTNPAHLESMLWNKIDDMYRILPNKSIRAVLTGLNAGSFVQDNIYRYYALYEKVTPNMQYELLDNNTFAVSGLTQANVTSLNIPFAKYHDGYMKPITKINSRVFEGISSGTGLSEIAIGGAVSDIGQNAFSSVNAKQINFAHRGREIRYNYNDTPIGKLTIGQEAFARNQVVERIVLPSALETLRDRAFQSCTSLLSVTFDTVQPSLNNLGNFIFRDNKNMTSNEVVRLLMEDDDYTRKFVKVGDGIFMNSGITNLFVNGKATNKIVWRNKLLHVFYLNAEGFNDLTFNEKEIGGYAFVNAGSNQDANVKITLRFSNPETIIHADAFSYLHTGVTNIYLKKNNNNSIKLDNVDINAFDDTIKHSVTVHTNNKINWDAKFKEVANAGFVRFN